MSALLNMITGKGNNADSNSSHSSTSSSSMSSHSMGSSSSMSSGSTSSMSSGPTSTTGYNTNTHTQGYSNSGYGTSGAGTGTATGVAGYNQTHGTMAQTTSTTTGARTDVNNNNANDQYITRAEEQLRVGKETFETGRAQLGKHVTTEHVSTSVPISKERVVVEREPISSADIQAGNLRGDIGEASYEMRLKEERAIAEKEVVPIEKVRMRKEVETTQQEVGAELRKEHIDFNDGMSTNTDYNKTDAAATTGTTYNKTGNTASGMPTTSNTGYGTTNTQTRTSNY